MRLESKDFQDGSTIPSEFTCDGRDISPQLSWEDVPEGTKSFALSVTDPDAPGGEFIHWLVYDIPQDVRNIDRASVPEGAEQVENDFGKKEYGGPCPPSGTHRYIFTLFALDTEHLKDVNRNNFFDKVEKHSLAKAELKGLYQRKR
ncbi:YbhB/YbcL family Raf kinase inhibitor-like protein [Candidatus Bathyarchaeota archaeon]|nr:MAG: YbhB/YbcL family Raf kinase inhibitor-like protein [Candidatus Bathyarchaeota archaeon]